MKALERGPRLFPVGQVRVRRNRIHVALRGSEERRLFQSGDAPSRASVPTRRSKVLGPLFLLLLALLLKS